MADPTTTNIVLAVPVRGSNVGVWDTPVNGDFTIIDACFGSVTTKGLTNVNVTLTVTEAQANLIRLTGVLTGNVNVLLPAIIKGWSVENLCTGSFYVVMGNASGGQVVGLPPGETIDVYSDGTNVKYRNLGRVASYMDIADATVPTWISNSTVPPYLNCDGSTYSSVTYPYLFAKLGTTTLPDKRGRQGIALNQGTSRVTTANSGVDGDTRFASGGAPNRVIAAGELPAVAPTFIPAAISVTSNVGDILRNPSGLQVSPSGSGGGIGTGQPGGFSVTSTGVSAGSIANLGNGDTHINMDPTLVYGITLIRAA